MRLEAYYRRGRRIPMKKKLFAVTIATMILMSSAMTAFAQPSVGAGPVVDVESATDKDGKDYYHVEVESLKGQELAAAQEIVKPENLETVLSKEDAKKQWTTFMVDTYAADQNGNEVEWGKDGEGELNQITFSVADVKKDSDVKVLFYDEGEWKSLTVVNVQNGKVTVAMNKLGPIVILAGLPDDGDHTSPVTGSGNAILWVALVATIAFMGALATKQREN